MKLQPFLVLTLAALLPAQKPVPAKPAPVIAAAPAAGAPATLADLQRDFQDKKFAALDAYAKAHPAASDVAAALVEAVGLARDLGRPDNVLRLADQYLKQFASGGDATAMQIARAGALADRGDAAGAQQAYEAVIDKAGDDVDSLIAATTALAEMLVGNGKKGEAVELLNVVGASRPQVRGLKEHFAGIAATYDLIGTEPVAIGKNDIAGKPIDLAAYKGKVLLIDFWATWCGPCVGELPNVLAAYEKYHAKGFEIVGISLDQDRAAFDKFTADRKMTWRHYFDGKGGENEVAALYGVKSIPATYLVGTDGKIVAVGLRGEALGRRLGKLLDGGKPAAGKK